MIMFAGPAGAGKSSLARAWCATRPRAVHVELDEVRHLIVSGLADPQVPGPLQAEQYDTSVAACYTLVREFVGSGYDVAVDDAVDPKGFERPWRPRLGASNTLWWWWRARAWRPCSNGARADPNWYGRTWSACSTPRPRGGQPGEP